jgi:hypothetical protein
MMRPHRPPYREKGWLVPISQQYSRLFDPARRFRSRAGNRAQRHQIASRIANSIACRQAAMTANLASESKQKDYKPSPEK